MNGVLGHDCALYGYTGPGTTCTNEMNFGMNQAPGAGSLARPADRQSSTLLLPPISFIEIMWSPISTNSDTTTNS